jgi:thermitase
MIMLIEGFVVRFSGPQTPATARAAIGAVVEHRGVLAGIAQGPEALDASQTVWSFGAPGEAALLSEPEAWDLAYDIRAQGGVQRAEPLFVVPGMPIADLGADTPQTFGTFLENAHLPESSPVDWAIQKLNVRNAWVRLSNLHPGQAAGLGVSIGHPDTGFTPHPEVVPGAAVDLSRGRNFKDNGPAPPIDPLTGMHAGHGTATCSVFLSPGNTAIAPGVLGVSPGATLVPLRMQDSVVHFHWGRLVRAIYHAADSNCHVISMSLGGAWGGDSLRDAVRYAVRKGVVLIAAAGNHTPFVCYPAKYDDVLAVAGSNARDLLWSGSALGSAVDITAPGESVWRGHARLDRDGNPSYSVARGAGTSYATALTAGICALWQHYHGRQNLMNQYGGALASVFRALVQSTARPVPGWPAGRAGPGIVDADALLAAPLPAAGAISMASAAVHPRLTEIASYRNESTPTTEAWLSSQLGVVPAALPQELDDLGAELSLVLMRKAFADTAAPIPMTGAAVPRKSRRLSFRAPGV